MLTCCISIHCLFSIIQTTDLDTHIYTYKALAVCIQALPTKASSIVNESWCCPYTIVVDNTLYIYYIYNCYYVTAVPGSPTLIVPPPTSDPISGNQVTLQWIPPTDTGGPGVDITHYVVDVTGPAGVTCSPEPCNMTIWYQHHHYWSTV